jgi:N-hydroxyarylamine O-acetyltransferase
MDVNKYLDRIHVKSIIKPDLETLRLVHHQHLYTIPFENLDIHSGRKIILDKEKLIHKIIDEERGGFCYELNGAFYELLKATNFNVKRISAGVYSKGGKFSPDFDHMALIVNLKDEHFLADVGFGDSFIEPIRFQLDIIQKDLKNYFRITKSSEDDYFILSRSADGIEFIPQYRFTTAERELSEFHEMCVYHQTSPESHFTQKVICSIAVPDGRISLSDLKLIITKNGNKDQKDISENEIPSILKNHFNISLQSRLIIPPDLSKKS